MAFLLSLDLYKVVFFAELLLGELLFIMQMEKRPHFWLRFATSSAIAFVLTYFLKIFSYNALYASFLFFLLFCLSLGVLLFCFKTSFVNILFCGIAGYSTQHLAYQFTSVVLVASGLLNGPGGVYGSSMPENMNLIYLPIGAVTYFMVYWAVFVFVCRNIEDWKNFKVNHTSLLVLVGVILALDILVNAFVTYNGYVMWDKIYALSSSIGGIICCTLTFWVQFGLIQRKKLKTELESIHRLYRQEQKQLITSKTNIDLINQKCHDLKYQIRAIGFNGKVRETVIREIEDCISIYDSVIKTGNKTLDTILTEKSLLCRKNNITFTCVCDGEKLNFINDVDLFTLFGNAVDNAVEAVMRLDEAERVISLTTHLSQKLFSVSLKNYYKGDLKFKGTLPASTKGDDNHHGFGMKSIQTVVEKYGGDMYVTAQNGVFSLNMLFILDEIPMGEEMV